MNAGNGRLPPVITVGGYDNALTLARSLARRGVAVHALGAGWALRYSRFVHWLPPEDTGTTSDDWLTWLTREGARRLSGAVLLPCNDEAAELLASRRTDLLPHYRLPESRPDLVLAMLDKAATYAKAAEIGIAAPRIWRLEQHDELEAILPELSYPCALKPRYSHLFRRHFPGRKLFVVHDATELRERFDELTRREIQVVVTEIIPGDDDRYCSYGTWLDEQGRPLFHFTKRKPRQYPIHFGLGTYHVTEWLPEVADLGTRFLESLGMRGPASVEFKRDPRDGRLKLIECNPRIVAATYEIAERSGLDLARIIYSHLIGHPRPAPNGYRSGVRLWFPLHDYRAFRDYQRSGELSWRRWLGTVARHTHVSQFQWSDPLPVMAFASRTVVEWARQRFGAKTNGTGQAESDGGRPKEIPPVSPMLRHPIFHPSSWTARELGANDSWQRTLSAVEAREITNARHTFTASGRPWPSLSVEDSPLPSLGRMFEELRGELENGHGLALLRGIPLEGCGLEEAKAIHFVLMSHLGQPVVQQNDERSFIDVVADRGADYGNPDVKGYETNAELSPHCDSGDVVGLLCVRRARSGGVSTVASFPAIHEAIRVAHPEYLEPLYRGFHYNLRAGGPPGPWQNVTRHRVPVFTWHEGRLSGRFNARAIRTAHRLAGIEPLTPLEEAAIDCVEALALDPDLRFDMLLEPGDLQLCCNYTIIHTRTRFEDDPDPQKRRLLLRMWVNLPGGRDLPDEFADHYNTGPRCGPFVASPPGSHRPGAS